MHVYNLRVTLIVLTTSKALVLGFYNCNVRTHPTVADLLVMAFNHGYLASLHMPDHFSCIMLLYKKDTCSSCQLSTVYLIVLCSA